MTKNEFAEVCTVFGEILLLVGEKLIKNDKNNIPTCTQAKNEEVVENTVPDIKEDMKEDYCYDKKLGKYKYCPECKRKDNRRLKGLEKIKNEKVQEAIQKELKSLETKNINFNKGIYINEDILISIQNHAEDIGNLIRDLRYIKNEEVKKFFHNVEDSSVHILEALHNLRKTIDGIE